MNIKKKIGTCLVGLFSLLLAFAGTERMEAAPSISELNGGPIKLIYDYIGHYELNYTGNTNNYDYWNSSGTSKTVSKTYRDRTDLAVNNSSATISKTDSKSKIVKAILIWETRSEKGVTNPITFVTPTNYGVPVAAQWACKDIRTNAAGQEYTAVYTMATDVTSIVCGANGGYGTYTVANIPVWNGAGNGVACGGESVASWQLVIVEESPNFPLRTISLNLLSQYYFNIDYTIKLDFADASSPNGEVTASFIDGHVNVDSSYVFDGIGYEDDYNYYENGNYFRYKTQTRGLYKNGVNINNRDTGTEYQTGKKAVGATRIHLYDDKRRANSAGSQELVMRGKGTNMGDNVFLYGVAIDIFAYDIIFDGNGATLGSMDNQTCIYGRGYTLLENKFKKQYHEFVEWNTKPDGSGISYKDRESIKNLTSTEPTVTLYAQWKSMGFTISLDHQDATTFGTTDYYEKYGYGIYADDTCSTAITHITVPTKIGNAFGGYYTGANGQGTQYIKPDGTITASSTTFIQDSKLYAKWTPAVYKITLDNQGATSAGTPQYYEKFNIGNYADAGCTTSISRITSPTKAHHTFQGYYMRPNGEGPRVIDENGYIAGAYTLFDSDTTIYAHWEPVTYTITLDKQGGGTSGTDRYYEKYGVANFSEYKVVSGSNGTKSVEFTYTGTPQSFIAPHDGIYSLMAFGAGGYLADANGAGGVSAGKVYLKEGEILWVYVGGMGTDTTGGYNGGGNAGVVKEVTDSLFWHTSGGGGATDFRKGGTSLSNRIMVAHGGSGYSLFRNGNFVLECYSPFPQEGGWSHDSLFAYGYMTYPFLAIDAEHEYIPGGVRDYSNCQDVASTVQPGYTFEYGTGSIWESLNGYTVHTIKRGGLGTGTLGSGGGYYGGDYFEISARYPDLVYGYTEVNYIVPNTVGTSYIKGVEDGVMYGCQYSAALGTYTYHLAGVDTYIAPNTGNGFAYVTYDDYSYTTELKEATSITIPKKSGYRFGGYYTGTNGTGTCYVDASGNILSSTTTFTSNTTLYAYWIEDGRSLYRIAFNGNGATSGSMSIMECYFNTNYTLHGNAFTKAGYNFTGWNTKPNGSGNWYTDYATVNNLSVISEDTITLYAQWTVGNSPYKVNHYLEKLDGGWSLYASDVHTGTTHSMVETAWFIKTITGFSYHHADINGYSATSAVIQPDGSLVIDMYYTRNWYTVTLNAGTGISSVSGAGAYRYEDSVTVDADVSTGYTWYNWTGTHSSEKRKYDFTMPAYDITMTATTSPLVFEITLNNQGASSAGTLRFYEKYSVGNYTSRGCTTAITNITIPSKTGYVFSGYYTGENGTGYLCINSDGAIITSSTAFAADTMLYAKWTPISYIIRFEGNGATGGSMGDCICIFNELHTLPKNTFTKTHYAFQSWNTKADGSGTTYINGCSVENLTTVPNGVITLYAQWAPNKYIIHFDANGGEGYMADITLSYDEAARLPLNAFTRSNEYGSSTFLGWNILADTREILYLDGAEVVNATEEDGSTLTLYAIWDDCPWINATDQYYSLDDAKNGRITYDELISHATASDKEDGEHIPAGVNPETGTSFTIIDYAPTDFSIFESDGSVTETFQVIDSVGNSYKQMITVYIVDTEPKEAKPEGTVRFINEKYYYLPYEEGGLEDNSIWKTDPEYVAVMEDAFRRSRENDPEMTFYFTYETILEMKEFIRVNGIGNTVHDDALQRFYDEFMVQDCEAVDAR